METRTAYQKDMYIGTSYRSISLLSVIAGDHRRSVHVAIPARLQDLVKFSTSVVVTVWVCGNVCCVAAVVKDSVLALEWYVVFSV